MPGDPDQSRALRAALRDLVALSTIPAAWIGREPSAISTALADVLVGSLGFDFAFVRLCDPKSGAVVDAMRGNTWTAFPQWLEAHGRQISRKEIIPEIGGAGSCPGVVIPIGVAGEGGLVAAACARGDFPSETDQLLLSVAANQAATAFQSARLVYEQRRAEEALRQSEQELRRTSDQLEIKVLERTDQLQRSQARLKELMLYLAEAQRLTHAGSFGWNPRAGEIFWSEETFRIFEYEPSDKVTFEMVIARTHPEDRAFVETVCDRAAREDKHFDFEHRLLMPDGSVKYLHIVGAPAETANSPSNGTSEQLSNVEFFGAVVDVTERKRAEEALRRSEAYLAEAQKMTHTGSWAVDVATRTMIHSSDEHSRMFGLDPRQGVPSFEMLVERVHPEDRDRTIGAMERAIREKSDFEVECRLVLPDGTVKFTHGVGHPVLNASGELVSLIGTTVDMTERKHAEEEREQLLANLAHISRVTTVGELTASLAHEVNQPIAAAVTNASTCLRWLARDPPDVEEARESATGMVKAATRAAEIVSRLRSLFRKGVPQREWVDVNEIIREMVLLLRSETSRQSISLRADLGDDLPPLMADRVQLQQVIMNLMLNGVEAMRESDGRRELTIKSQRGEAEQLVVSVSDTGVGLPSGQSDQIFNPFFTTKPHGTGMGLTISRSIVESHGGRLWASANVGSGATFSFSLPSQTEAHEMAPPGPDSRGRSFA